MNKNPPYKCNNFFKAQRKRHERIEKALPNWNATWIAANWSSPIISLEAWRKSISESTSDRCSLLENAVEHLPAWGFIKWYGQENFKKNWPSIRECCPMRLFKNRAILDMYWSILETGSFRIQPLKEWFSLTSVEQDFLRNIMRSEGRSIDNVLLLCKDPNPANCLQKLIQSGFLFQDKGRIWRDSRYEKAQSPRRPVTKTFMIKGKKITFTSPVNW